MLTPQIALSEKLGILDEKLSIYLARGAILHCIQLPEFLDLETIPGMCLCPLDRSPQRRVSASSSAASDPEAAEAHEQTCGQHVCSKRFPDPGQVYEQILLEDGGVVAKYPWMA